MTLGWTAVIEKKCASEFNTQALKTNLKWLWMTDVSNWKTILEINFDLTVWFKSEPVDCVYRSLSVLAQHCKRLRTLDISMCKDISITTVDLLQSQLPFLENVHCRFVGGADLTLTLWLVDCLTGFAEDKLLLESHFSDLHLQRSSFTWLCVWMPARVCTYICRQDPAVTSPDFIQPLQLNITLLCNADTWHSNIFFLAKGTSAAYWDRSGP